MTACRPLQDLIITRKRELEIERMAVQMRCGILRRKLEDPIRVEVFRANLEEQLSGCLTRKAELTEAIRELEKPDEHCNTD